MTPRLTSVSVTDFRSIRGSITVPLDSPVVLIHGQNGVGKTSLLTAIELGLTGRVESLERLDGTSNSHLVHKEAAEGRVSVAVEGLADPARTVELKSINREFVGQGLLCQELSKFFSERCYLAQSTLGRLLEVYQSKDARHTDSPLTRFVKDLLGLDQLDALVEGLHDAGDVRRLRSGAPLYWDVREGIPRVEKENERLNKERSLLEMEFEQLRNSVRTKLILLGLSEPIDLSSQQVINLVQSDSNESELQKLAKVRRDIKAVADQWAAVESGATTHERATAEAMVKTANEAVERWRTSTGQRLESTFEALRSFFSDLPSPTSTRPGQALSVALQSVTTEHKRCTSVLSRDAEDVKQLESIDEEIAKARARVLSLDEQIARHAETAGRLAEALAAILPHVHSENCPVCSRDFSEVSDKPLSAHISSRIFALTESAGRLQALSRERVEGATLVANTERSRGATAGRVLTSAVRDELKTKVARLSEFQNTLLDLAQDANEGEKVLGVASEASGRLNALRAKDQKATSVRDAAQRFAQDLALDPVGESEHLTDALQRFLSHVTEAEEALSGKEVARRDAAANLKQIVTLSERSLSLAKAIQDGKSELQRMSRRKTLADSRIAQAKELGRRAREERTRIVRRVFNDSLNSIWRDLFVRLAPDEPFVPSFALPESEGGAVVAILETLYRTGGKGGNPRAMLSAGNLNTAALTLFLALHMSVKPSLPWLLIDDPVQSMDEVHIAQFAALLRTLSKQHHRQIIIAVHEKPLFDYLALELSPAFANDRLITVEIGRNSDGATITNYERRVWVPDQAVAA